MDIFESSDRMIVELLNELNKSNYIDGGLRLDLVYECCDLSIVHGVAIRSLLERELTTSALALLRVQADCVARAYWMLMIASNEKILKFECNSFNDLFSSEKMPMLSEVVESLKTQQQIPHIVAMLEEFKFYYKRQLDSVIHSGKHSLLNKRIGLNDKQIINLVKITNALTIMAAQILLKHSFNEDFITYINHKYSSCFEKYDDISNQQREIWQKLFK